MGDDLLRAEQVESQALTESFTPLQAQMAEWARLHRLLHAVVAAFAPFRARLLSLDVKGIGLAEHQVLLQDWRLCQGSADELADFAEDIRHIGRPFRREGRELEGERWVVDIVALRLLIEDTLKENGFSLWSLIDLAEEFNDACHRHLNLANSGLRAALDEVQRLFDTLLGELQ
jgi:hypothetical protein